MTQAELVRAAARRARLPAETVHGSLKAALSVIAETLARGERVKLRDFGVFKSVALRSTRRKHFHTQQELIVKDRVTPRFRASPLLRQLLAEKLTVVKLPNGRVIAKPR